MKKLNCVQVVCTVFCLFLIFLGAASYVVRIGTRAFISATGKTNSFTAWLFKDQPALNNEENRKHGIIAPVIIDWQSMYSFSEESLAKAQKIEEAVQKNKAVLSSEDSAVQTAALNVENNLKPASNTSKVISLPEFKIPGKFEIERWYNRFFRKEMFTFGIQFLEGKANWNLMPPSDNSNVVKGFIKLKSGNLTVLCPHRDMTAIAESIKSFDKFLKEENIPFVYVMAPSVISPDEKNVSNHWDFSNQNADELMTMLETSDVCTIDLRKAFEEDNINYADAFYVTDHHWLPETGVWATEKIASWLNKNVNFNCDINTFKIENYDKTVYPKFYLGTFGKKATLARVKADDFVLLHPKNDVKFHYINPAIPCDKTGDFDIIYHYELFEQDDIYDRNAYAAYLGNKYAAFIDNLDENVSGKVLVVGDSYLLTVVPFLAQTVKRVEYLSMDYFDGSLENYIKKNGPYDACFMLFYTGDLTDKIDFSTHRDMFDFR